MSKHMYLKEERLMVLKLLEDGKIDVEEATNLIETLSETSKKMHFGHMHGNCMEENNNKISDNLENFVKSFGSKVDNTFKEVEPCLKKASKKAIEKTYDIISRISDKLKNTLDNMETNQDQQNQESDENNCHNTDQD